MKAFLQLLVRLLYRFRAYDTEVLTTPGPVLLLPNHISWLDWLFLAVCLDDDWKFVTSANTAKTSWLHHKVMVNKRTFPIDPNSPYAVKQMAEYLQKGGRLVLFPEGRLSRTGNLMKLFDGTGFLIYKTHAKVITCYLRKAHRLPLSPHSGWKEWFPEVTAHFSGIHIAPKLEHLSTAEARRIVTDWLRDQLVNLQFKTEMEFGEKNLVRAIAETAADIPNEIALEDINRTPVTFRKLLVGSDLMAQQMRPLLPAQTAHVGVLLPNIAATPVVCLSLWSLGHVPAVLNFSTGIPVMIACAQLAGMKQIITSREFLRKARLDVEPLVKTGIQFLYLEDMRAGITGGQKLITLLKHILWPRHALTCAQDYEATAVILFTSGSEGVPKGVELTHKNILANIRQMLAITDLQDNDRVFNCLPMFHSFGLTVGTLLPLVRGLYSFVYPSPLHYRVVPTALYDRDCTVFLSTNTFLNGYARKAHAYDFRSMRYLFAAAEKLQETTAKTWSEKFGVRILEGYGATECSPCVSVNTPLQPRNGTVGRLLPGIEYKLEPVEGVEDGGRLHVRGPNIMKGYLNADANAKFKAEGGWYDTGDIVAVDSDGFLSVRGRMKRFAKISGEMVSLTAVEDALAGAFPQFGLRCQIAVVAVPDEEKGEKLIAISNEPKLTLDDLRKVIKEKGLSNLNVPREVKAVREIPKLGTGKVNHRELQKLISEETPVK
ncbi:MAG: AMP-binding protein [Verrucomicrobiota bacterium]